MLKKEKVHGKAKKPIAVVTFADQGWVEMAKQLFSSVYYNAGFDGDYVLLALGIDEKSLSWFEKRGIIVRRIKYFSQSHDLNITHSILMHKFELYDIYFKQWEKIIFLDADIIVRASLDNLKEIDTFAAVPDLMYEKRKQQFISKNLLRFTDRKLFKEYLRNKNIVGTSRRSFNSGVFVLPTRMIRVNSKFVLLGLFHRFEKLMILGEQPILNLYFSNWKPLPYAYNTSIRLLTLYEGIKPKEIDGVVLHFMSKDIPRPWDPKSPFYPEWHSNFIKAELIKNVHDIQPGRVLSRSEILRISSRYYNFWYCSRYSIYRIAFGTIIWTNDVLGILGAVIKKVNPGLYNLIQKCKKNIY